MKIKFTFFLFITLLATLQSCSSDSSDDEIINEPRTGRLLFDLYYEDVLSAGDTIAVHQKAELLSIFKADGTDFDIEKSKKDLPLHLYDKNKGQSVKADYADSSTSFIELDLIPGRYFIYFITGDDKISYVRFVNSYTYFDIKKGQTTTLSKVLKQGFNEHQKWSILDEAKNYKE